MRAYQDLLRKILVNGIRKPNRTGVDTFAISGAMFEHDMADGFPLLTTKRIPFRLIASELEFFLRGLTDKQWLKDRNNHIWDEWCSPDVIPYSTDPDVQARMMAERELGPIYGWQWRHFGATYVDYETDYTGQGIDQLKNVIDTLKRDPMNRRMMVSTWNPMDISRMALPTCHYGFQVTVLDGRLNLLWNQRSVDVGLGLPFNIACYALLLHLLAKETGLEEGRLTGFLADVHIYENHRVALTEQCSRDVRPLPRVVTQPFTGVFDWEYTHSRVEGYDSHPTLKMDVAI